MMTKSNHIRIEPTYVNKMTTVDPQEQPPTIAYVFSVGQWLNVLHPVTKLELTDVVPAVNASFFYDASAEVYVLSIQKPRWESVPDETKRRFKVLTRRVREEIEGLMTDAQRLECETKDPFASVAAEHLPSQGDDIKALHPIQE